MYVCTRITDGYFCGSQSNAPASGAMESQAVQDYGGAATDFEVSEIDEASYAALLAAANAPQPPTLEQAKAAKTAEIADTAEDYLEQYQAEYRATEIATWDQQYAEAQAYMADNAAGTPLLSAIAAARSMTVPELAARIIANHDAWVALGGAIIGRRLALQDQVDAATTLAEVAAVSVTYG